MNRKVLNLICAFFSFYFFSLSNLATAAIVTRALEVTLISQNFDSFQLDVFGNPANPRTDFTFQTAFAPDPDLTVGFAQAEIPFGTTNGVVIDGFTGDGFPSASLLNTGDIVSSSSLFSFGSNETGNLYSFDTLNGASGNFGGRSGYVGLRFADGADTFYGYAFISVNDINSSAPLDLTVHSVTYNTVAGQGLQITAVPEPTSFLLIASSSITAFYVIRLRRHNRLHQEKKAS